jgi:hypothetical protein
MMGLLLRAAARDAVGVTVVLLAFAALFTAVFAVVTTLTPPVTP